MLSQLELFGTSVLYHNFFTFIKQDNYLTLFICCPYVQCIKLRMFESLNSQHKNVFIHKEQCLQ